MPEGYRTRLGVAMTETLVSHPEYADEKCIVFLMSQTDDQAEGSMTTHGYEDSEVARMLTDMLTHVEATLQMYGLNMMIVDPEKRK
jgi:hypothetical protein